ncbi:hypothetical protein [Streptomyces hesseae]|uniref:Aromatic ring-opening dioxygenase LigA n=1 Tax=Streptomyces hesseae TaxID=3075519 RepID=A0ABU2SI57_9ACTN|nr:hypothetical protein [Streptomyces sp. DSM 40473]MDT0448069.1 hypothetical protein [Streptomyces sp. DSM 40473]
MPHTLPLPIPSWLVDHHQLDLTALYSSGWGMEHDAAAPAPNGDLYALYRVWRHHHEAKGSAEPAEQNFGYGFITRYAPDGTPLATVLCGQDAPDGTPSALTAGSGTGLAVLPDGTLAMTGLPDCTYLIAPDLSRVLAAYTMPYRWPFDEVVPGDPFATAIRVTPRGRLLCVASEFGVHRYGNCIPNLITLADGPLGPDHKPNLEAIASLDSRPAHQTEADQRPHVRYQGRPVGLEHRPSPSLPDLVARDDDERHWYDRARLGTAAEPLTDELFVVPVLGREFRSGSRGQVFAFALLNAQGEVTGRLEGLDKYKDSPFTGRCYSVATAPDHGLVFHLNRYGLYAWTADGRLRARLGTEDKPFKALAQFTLMTCSSDGVLVLFHRKQHLILRIPTRGDLDGLTATVETALRAYARERAALKKQWGPVNWHWVQSAAE